MSLIWPDDLSEPMKEAELAKITKNVPSTTKTPERPQKNSESTK